MSWLHRYRARHYIENSISLFPILAIVAGLVTARALNLLDAALGWKSALQPDAARTVLAALASSMFTCVVFVSSALLLVVQLASAQLTPRIIGSMFRDSTTKISLTLFVFTFTLSMAALVRVTDTVPKLTVLIATYGCVISIGTLLYLVGHVGQELRPSGAMRGVARSGRGVIQAVYKRTLSESAEAVDDPAELPGNEPSYVFPNPKDGVVLAVDIEGLVALAAQAGCLIEMAPQVGQFVSAGEPLFRTYGGGRTVTPRDLGHCIALGQERTLEQDPTLAFRIIVDIACKALSPAINDPTTAVLAIDQIHHLLRIVGRRKLDEGGIRDARGILRLVYRRPTWEDYVSLAATETRHYGKDSIQVVRRLKAMFLDLIQSLPDNRAATLRRQLNLLHRTCERSFAEPEDRASAEIGDFPGRGRYGGTERSRRPQLKRAF
ncbi:MAG TPA: DUF2254 domain-containing protein [Tepidisphaeraceae bacterium]|nr:DUF2254 domain-containing protein [Tepidisphaeraceae bacterium]